MTLLDSLQNAALGFAINAIPTAGNAFRYTISLDSPLSDRNTLTITETVTEIQDGALNVLWRLKDVRYATEDIIDIVVVGGQPITGLLQLNAATVTKGAVTPAGVPGNVGTLSGTVPIPIQTVNTSNVNVDVAVRWQLVDQNGVPVADTKWTGATTPQVTSGTFTPSAADVLQAVTLDLSIAFAELVVGLPPVVNLSLRASIRLSATGATTGWIDLPPVPLVVPQVGIPTIAIFFRDIDLAGHSLVMVPTSSPIDQASLGAALGTVRDVLDPLGGVLAFLTLFVTELDTTTAALNATKITFRKADVIDHLGSVVLEDRWFGDLDADDEMSSMVLIGPPNRTLRCCNDSQLKSSEGRMDVTIPNVDFVSLPFIVTLRDLRNVHSAPPPEVRIVSGPSGWNWTRARSIKTFNDELTSVGFA
jgi:hypothetical protein